MPSIYKCWQLKVNCNKGQTHQTDQTLSLSLPSQAGRRAVSIYGHEDWGKTPVAPDYIYSEIPPWRPVSLFVRLTTYNSEARDATHSQVVRPGVEWIVSIEIFTLEIMLSNTLCSEAESNERSKTLWTRLHLQSKGIRGHDRKRNNDNYTGCLKKKPHLSLITERWGIAENVLYPLLDGELPQNVDTKIEADISNLTHMFTFVNKY